MSLCPGQACPHYGQATKYPRKCFYEPQCWKGYADVLIRMAKRPKVRQDEERI